MVSMSFGDICVQDRLAITSGVDVLDTSVSFE